MSIGLTYGQVHHAIRRERGSADALPCVDCWGPADEWSWDHEGPTATCEQRGRQIEYGTDIESYSARCRRCHGIRDRGGSLTEYPCGHPRTEQNTVGGDSCRECHSRISNDRRRERYATDPQYRERVLSRNRARRAER